MLPKESLKILPARARCIRDKARICLVVSPVGPRQVSDIKALVYPRSCSARNVSGIGQQRDSLHQQAMVGELTASGIQYVATIAGWLLAGQFDGRFLTANCLDQNQTQTRRHLLKRRSPATKDASFGRRWCCSGLSCLVFKQHLGQYAWPSYGVQQRRADALLISKFICCRQKS